MIEILQRVKEMLPDNAKISNYCFEGANIILYTKNKEFFLNNGGIIRGIVDTIKKRVELRPDPSLTLDMEKAEEMIKNILSKEVGELNIIFDPQRSIVIIEAEKPGVAIGKRGEVLKEIKDRTIWVPLVRRIPAIRSKIIENIRQVLYENNDYRKRFLNKVGERIYGNRKSGKKTEWIRLTFLGGAREVGRSSLFLQTPESKILIDCGVNVAATTDEKAYPYFNIPEFDIKDIDAIIVSHQHLDHSALTPLLYKYGYNGPVYCTAPTRDIMALLWLDFISIAQKEAKKALYTAADVKEVIKHTICLDFEEVTDITPDVRLTLYNSGHALGSAMCHFHIGEGLHNLLYSSDMNYEQSNLLDPAITKFPRLETVILEGTYGGKEDSGFMTREEAEHYLLDIIKKTLERGGKVLLPTLGVGRSQEIMLVLEKAVRQGLIEKIPVYIQGMVWDVTAIHTAYPDFFSNRVKKLIFHKDTNPFLSDMFKRVGSRKEMMQVLEETGPCVIMATSGMMVGGPSVEYFKHLASNPKNSLVFTCYQGLGSLGRRIQSGEKEIAFSDGGNKQEIVKVNMEIHSLHSFTGHSTREQLINFVRRLSPQPRKIIVNHGDGAKCIDLASSLHKMYRVETIAPKVLDTIRIR